MAQVITGSSLVKSHAQISVILELISSTEPTDHVDFINPPLPLQPSPLLPTTRNVHSSLTAFSVLRVLFGILDRGVPPCSLKTRPYSCHFPPPFSDLAPKLHTRFQIFCCRVSKLRISAEVKKSARMIYLWILLFLWYSFGVEKTNTFIRSQGFLENHTRFKTDLYPFSDQNGSKTISFGAAHTYIAYIGEYSPSPHPGEGALIF